MTPALEQDLQNLAERPLTSGELESGLRYLVGAVNCLLNMRMEVIKREGGNFNQSINQGARGGTQLARPKYTPVRIR